MKNSLFLLLNMGGLGSTRFILKEGGSMGDIYSFDGFEERCQWSCLYR